MRVRLTDEQRDLAESHLRGAFLVANPYIAARPELREAMEDAAVSGLMDFAAAYDPRGPFAPMTLLTCCVEHRCNTALRWVRTPKRTRCAAVRLGFDPAGRPAPPRDTDPGLADRLLRVLPARDREMTRSRVLDGDTFAAVGARHGVSRERARQVVRRSLSRLRSHPTVEALAP